MTVADGTVFYDLQIMVRVKDRPQLSKFPETKWVEYKGFVN